MRIPFAAPARTDASRPRPPHRRRAARPRLESLEGRVVLSSYAFDSFQSVGGGDQGSVLVRDSAVDSAGNSYVTGGFLSTVDFDPGVDRADGSDVLSAKGGVAYDGFIAKYAPDNSLLWARRMGGDMEIINTTYDSYDFGEGLALDPAGNAYLIGTYHGPSDFGPITLAGGRSEVFVAKLDPDGNFVWANAYTGLNVKATGGEGRKFAGGIAVDAAGNVVTAGSTAAVDSTGTSWTMNGFNVRKYTPAGSLAWSARYDNWGGDASGGVKADAAGNVYVGGQFGGTLDFNLDPRKTASVTGSSTVRYGEAVNAYVLKLTAAGTFGWVAPLVAKTAAAPASVVRVNDFALDAAGNVLVGGSYAGQVDFDPAAKVDRRLPNLSADGDGYVAKLTPAGALAWATPLGGGLVLTLAVDASGNSYAAGTFGQTFTPGYGLPAATDVGGADGFVARLNPTGAVNWAGTFGGTGSVGVNGIAVDGSGAIYLTGTYSASSDGGTYDFDPDPQATYEVTPPARRLTMFRFRLRPQ